MLKDDFLEGYTLSEDEEYMNPQMLEYFKAKLALWKEELIQESNKEQAAIISKTARESDHVDEAALDQDRSIDVFIADKDLNLLHEVDHALKRVEDGKYGYCENTGKEIGIKRLDAWPIARLTIEAQEKFKKVVAD